MSGELHEISVLGLAHIGDAVFELMVRTWLCMQGLSTAKRLHNETVAFVSARAQAAAAERFLPKLNETEYSVFKRGRNARVNSVPGSSTHEEYHTATGIEALFGYLYLKGETDRIGELFEIIIMKR
jgi:ribonuclease-3 family protein